MRNILFTLSFIFGVVNTNAQCGITFSVTPHDALGINSVLLSLDGTEAHAGFSVIINWGDASDPSIGFESEWVHTYPAPGTYEICIDFVAPTCIQPDYCESYTITETAEHSELCPLTVTYSMSGTVISASAEASGAVNPALNFHHDVLGFFDDPFDFSGFQFIYDHSGSFTYDYAPVDPEATFLFCLGYADVDEPAACESNDYCSAVTFGNPAASIEDNVDFLSTIQVYPVPATTYINVHFSELLEYENVKWTIYGLDGKEVLNGTLKDQLSTIYLPTTMVNGNYQLILIGDNTERTINFIKQ